jgi:Zn-dependent peptidase ImmA (M78 family)/transcriptional regulator with XRE-family HTH domain
MRLGTPGFSGKRLRLARLARALSETDLASKLGVSRQSISQYELGHQTPSPGILGALSGILALPDEYFMAQWNGSEPTQAVWFRSLQSTTRRARDAAMARFCWLLEIVGELERHVPFPAVDLPTVDVGDPLTLSDDDVERLASEYRHSLGVGEEPMPNLVAEVERRGVIVTHFDLLAPQLDAFSCWVGDGRACVVLDEGRPAVRQRLDLAHELGHLVLHRRVQEPTRDHPRYEKQAFRFAAGLLFPRRAFVREVLPEASLSSLLIPKRRWKVSIKMLIRRAHDLHVISADRMKQLFKQYSSAGYGRSGEPLDGTMPAEEPTLLRRAFDAALSSPEAGIGLRSIALPAAEAEHLCALPGGHLANWLVPAPRARPMLQGRLF